MPQADRQLIGRYEILEEIGRGAMGVVFKGRDPLIGRSVAVKTITAGVAESADLKERFYREARAAGGLQHPNIVTVYELAESGGAPFIAMEYLEGESLEKLIARQPELSLGTKINYVVQAARALDYAHRRGVIHRDVKPANIVVTADGIVKVVDFGIARIADTSKTQTGMLLGTLAYMSPEQLRGQHADARCDVWALGVVLYELIAYQRPFAGENHAALLLSILQNEPRPMRQIIPGCPAQLENVIARALRKDEKERYPAMEEFLKDLESVSAVFGASTLRPPPEIPSIMPTGGLDHTLAATQPISVPSLNAQEKISAAKTGAPVPVSAVEPSKSASPAARQAAARPPAPPAKGRAQARTAQSRSGGWALALIAILIIGAFAVFGFVRYQKQIPAALYSHVPPRLAALLQLQAATPAPAEPADTPPPAAATVSVPPASSTVPLAPPASAASVPAPIPVSESTKSSPAPAAEPPVPSPSVPSPSVPSIEDQQRHLIDLAHEAADQHDYKAAQKRLDEAAKLKGPLNGLVADLRREFSEEAHGAELQRVAAREQSLWDQGTAALQAGQLDDAEKSFRSILTLPEGGHRWADAERNVDLVIPQSRQDNQLWSEAQLQSNSQEPGHLLKEMKSLDDILAAGSPHQQQAREMRDAALTQMLRGNARRNRQAVPAVSDADQWQLTRLKNQFGDLVQKGDASALEQLPQLRPKFKAIVDAQGPLATDARDYLNNLIPKAQKHIEDNLAAAESESSANAAYQSAVQQFDRAVATQNNVMLRDDVLDSFRQIAQLGGVRAKEAQQYVDVLIPAALKKSGQQE